MAATWIRQLVSGLSPQRSGFAPRSDHLVLVMDKVTLHQAFLLVLRFSPVSIIPPGLHTHITPEERTIGHLLTAVQRHFLTTST
jgi:hypothetical protein